MLGALGRRTTAKVVRQRLVLQPERHNSLVIFGGLGVAASAVVAQYALSYYNGLKEAGPAGDAKTESSSASEDVFSTFFARRFYDGPFEAKMTRREAALILGVRESAAPDRIKDAHRRILRINHPDIGGSTFLAGKVNEAKDLLMKGR